MGLSDRLLEESVAHFVKVLLKNYQKINYYTSSFIYLNYNTQERNSLHLLEFEKQARGTEVPRGSYFSAPDLSSCIEK